MDDATAAAHLREHAHSLLQLARALQSHSVGERWQGPARRACSNQLLDLERRLLAASRRAEVLSHYLNVPDVRASLR
jgi:hypothetical protein